MDVLALVEYFDGSLYQSWAAFDFCRCLGRLLIHLEAADAKEILLSVVFRVPWSTADLCVLLQSASLPSFWHFQFAGYVLPLRLVRRLRFSAVEFSTPSLSLAALLLVVWRVLKKLMILLIRCSDYQFPFAFPNT